MTMHVRLGRTAAGLLAVSVTAALTSCGAADTRPGSPTPALHGTVPLVPGAPALSLWRGAWAASPQRPLDVAWSGQGFADHTLRQTVRLTAGGDRARVELGNRYGTTPLHITGATVARTAASGGGAVEPGSVRTLRFGGRPSVTVPPGGTLHSDAADLPVEALASLTVTLYLAERTGPATFHRTAAATSYRASGDHSADESGAAFDETSGSWYYLSGVEVSGGREALHRGGVVTFGDSITDGAGSTRDADDRYPDELAERLAAAGTPRAVLNHGISGNQVVNDTDWAGEKALTRFREDVLTEPGVRTVVILEGINDLGASEVNPPATATPEVSVDRLIAAHLTLIDQARARGLRVIGATLTPVKNSRYDTPAVEAGRDAFNHWVRTSGAYDAVADFDRALADPADPDRMLPAYDSGDHLHPGDAGYRAMAEALDLDAL
ncbi:SGNH/GDSL hydrolase family protein [Streptomyces sp. NPDC059534]|uniref:SGNH/GDSL hydrolase family protein n=1 Tax=Streptomyces sp. NPDC059534 TaxID=3346859 RepID=UPI0036C8DAED